MISTISNNTSSPIIASLFTSNGVKEERSEPLLTKSSELSSISLTGSITSKISSPFFDFIEYEVSSILAISTKSDNGFFEDISILLSAFKTTSISDSSGVLGFFACIIKSPLFSAIKFATESNPSVSPVTNILPFGKETLSGLSKSALSSNFDTNK